MKELWMKPYEDYSSEPDWLNEDVPEPEYTEEEMQEREAEHLRNLVNPSYNRKPNNPSSDEPLTEEEEEAQEILDNLLNPAPAVPDRAVKLDGFLSTRTPKSSIEAAMQILNADFETRQEFCDSIVSFASLSPDERVELKSLVLFDQTEDEKDFGLEWSVGFDLAVAEPTERFWTAWRKDKAGLKSSGYRVIKTRRGQWQVQRRIS